MKSDAHDVLHRLALTMTVVDVSLLDRHSAAPARRSRIAAFMGPLRAEAIDDRVG